MYTPTAKSYFSGAGLMDLGLAQAGPERNQYKQIGNGVPVPMARWIGELAMKYFNTTSR